MIGQASRIAENAGEFERIAWMVTGVIDPALRLPRLPFRPDGGSLAVGEFTRLVGVDFVAVFRTLAREHGDHEFFVMAIDPAVDEFSRAGAFPAFAVPLPNAEAAYWEGLTFTPSEDPTVPTVEIGEMANVLAVVGSSRRWAVWGQRSWEIALVWSSTHFDAAEASVPLVGPRQALEDFAGYGSWGTLLVPDEVESFIAAVEARR